MADAYSSLTPYQYGNNDPVYWNDPSGAYPGGDEWWNAPRSLRGRYAGFDSQSAYNAQQSPFDMTSDALSMYGGDDGMGMFGKAGTMGYDYSYIVQTPEGAWMAHLASIFPGDVFNASDFTIIDYFTDGDRERYIDSDLFVTLNGVTSKTPFL